MRSVQTAQPGAATQPYIARYLQRCLNTGGVFLPQPIPARVEQVIAFQFRDPCLIRLPRGTATAPNLVIAGPQTSTHTSLILHGEMEAFYIFLRPAALQLLFGIRMKEICDRSVDGRTLLGPPVTELHEQLAEAPTFHARVFIAESFFRRYIRHSAAGRAHAAMQRILRHRGAVSIKHLAADVSWSPRQLERVFLEDIGLSPKAFARIVRFQAALHHKASFPSTSWADAAQALQYHDQMHMIRDFRSLSGETPARLFASLAASASLD